jgi:hypothetical protein
MADLETRLDALIRANAPLMQVLALARDMALPDWLIVSGAVYQTVWNHLTDRPITYGLKDYDLVYFDAADISYEAEDVVIQRGRAVFPPPLDEMVEIRNQARVHLWFEAHFGEPYAPLANSAEALTRFLAPAFSVGVRLERDDRLTIVAPFGLDDLFALRLRPNPTRVVSGFDRTAARIRERWPEVDVIGA